MSELICSVRQRDGGYAYYEVGQPPRPMTQPELGSVGMAIEQALPTLPLGARQVGRGRRARGVLCRSTFGGLGVFGGTGTTPAAGTLFLGALAIGGAWALARIFG